MSRKVWNILLKRKGCTSLNRSTLDSHRDQPVSWTPQRTPALRGIAGWMPCVILHLTLGWVFLCSSVGVIRILQQDVCTEQKVQVEIGR